MRGADLIAQTLAKSGVDILFSLSGNQIMPIYDACLDTGIRIIHVRHESAAVYMAEAYAQITGGIGVALVTAAPGFTNALTPLYTATQSESPVLLLSGDSPTTNDGRGAFQELDQVSIATPLVKSSVRAVDVRELGAVLANAIQTALSGRCGPTHVALPFDIVQAELADATLPDTVDLKASVATVDNDTTEAIREQLRQAERPLVIMGPLLNHHRGGQARERLSAALDAPVISLESPRGIKDPALGRLAAVLKQADLVLSLGKKVDFMLGFGAASLFADDCRWLLVDPDANAIEQAKSALGGRLAAAFQCDARAQLAALAAPHEARNERARWIDDCAKHLAERLPIAIDPEQQPMHPAALGAAIQGFVNAASDPIVVIDGGEAGQWAQASLSSRTRIINGPSGAIGGSLSYALAAKLARPEATVVAVLGDGTAGFHFAEFETATRYGIGITAIIAHDARWNAEYQIQLRDFGSHRLIGCELDETRYDVSAAAIGCHGDHVVSARDVEPALAKAAASAKAACIVARIDGVEAPVLDGA